MPFDEDTSAHHPLQTMRSADVILLPTAEERRAFLRDLDADTIDWRPDVRPAAQPRGNGPRMAVAVRLSGGARFLR